MNSLSLPSQPKILVVALRRLGDVLLTTPLIHSLRQAWPDAKIDAMVFAETAGILEGNPDLSGIVAMPSRPSAGQSLALAGRHFRRYDLAISTQCGDRPTFFAIAAGKRAVAPTERTFNGRLKGALLDRTMPYESGVHRIEEILRLADLLGIARAPAVIAPGARAVEGLPAADFAVIHAAPLFRYKQWAREGWRALAAALSQRGLRVVATGGPGAAERRYLDDVWADAQVMRYDGRLGWPQLTGLLSKAKVYIGPDTSVTHLAAAVGCPTVAIYGPTNPCLWGPWPVGGLGTMWEAAGTVQHRGNVWLVQNPLPCMPCQLEGCERRLDSHSACLDELPAAQVVAAAEQALALKQAANISG